MATTAIETFEKLRHLRRAEPFRPFRLRPEGRQAVEVRSPRRIIFVEDHGVVYLEDGRRIPFLTDAVEITEVEAATRP